MPHPVDCEVGRSIRRRRWMVGMTQKQLATAVGIKFQQIQKYETGANRVSASRLFDIAKTLEVPISYFFRRLETGATQPLSKIDDDDSKPVPAHFFQDREAIELLRCYYGSPAKQRRHLFELTRSLSEKTPPEQEDLSPKAA